MTVPLSSPYKGLAAFDDSDLDALLFFGRDSDTQIAVANVLAARLTVLYGPSGVGKSSLLCAGVVRELRRLGRTEPLAVAAFASWSGDVQAGIEAAARQAVADALGADPGDVGGTLAERLDAWTAALGGELCLVLDQFEDALHRASLEEFLPELVTRPRLRINVLLGIRDDALAQLDAFKATIPGLFANTLRLDHLDRAAARSAILGPVARWNELAGHAEPIAVEPELVDAVLSEAGTQTDSSRVETTYLQLVLQRIWEVERERGSSRLRRATLSDLGGAEQIVQDHLERALAALSPSERDAAAAMFEHLVTPSGTKLAHRASDLATFAGEAPEQVDSVLRALSEQRILRRLHEERDGAGGERYEIYHDVLGEPIVAWAARHRSDRALEAEQLRARRRHRRLLRFTLAALVAVLFLSALTVYAFTQRHTARVQARAARSRELAASALSQLSVDPERALALAVKAADIEPGPRVDAALRDAMLESKLRKRTVLDRPVYAVDIDGARSVAASPGSLAVLDGRLRLLGRLRVPGRLLDVRSGTALMLVPRGLELRSLRDGSLDRRIPLRPGATLPQRDVERGVIVGHVVMPKRIRLVALGPHGTIVAASDGGREIVILNGLTGDARYRLEQPSAVTALAFGPGARTLVSGGRDGTARLWSFSTGKLRAELPGRGSVLAVAFSPRTTLLATAGADGMGHVWRTIGTPVTVLPGHTSQILDIAFSPNGRSIVTASADGTAIVWKALTGEQLDVFRASNLSVTAVRFTEDSDRVISAGNDRVVRLWDARAEPRLSLLADLGRPVEHASIVASGILATTGDGQTHLISLRGTNLGERRPRQTAIVRSSKGVAASIHGRTVELRDDSGRRVFLRGHHGAVTSVHFSADGTSVVTASRDATARIWDTATGERLHILSGHFRTVRDAEFSPDGHWVVTAGPAAAALWDADTGRRLFYLGGHTGPVTFAAFDATGARIFTAGVDGTIRTYRCDICQSGPALLAAARRRLAETGRA